MQKEAIMHNKNKICLITGSTSGIGYVMARELAKTGAIVVILSRSKQKGESARKRLVQESGNTDIHVLDAELAEMKQVKRVAEEFNATYPRLDVFIDNAGAFLQPTDKTQEALGSVFAVNYLSKFLLTNLLLDKLKATDHARIIYTCSHGHKMSKLNLNYSEPRELSMLNNGYNQSKLALIMFVYALADKLKGTSITVNGFHPGLVNSNFKNNSHGTLQKYLGKLIYDNFGITLEQGADTAIYLATSPDVANVTGKYFAKRKPVKSSKVSYDIKLQKQLWDGSVAILKSLNIHTHF
jgi:NAD(P)-dependent dehydrogenase (short-subunit alcohol dehydrogenase family)